MENNMYCKPMYKCGFCGKEHDNPLNRAQCELACFKKQEEEAKRAAELKKKEEHDARHKEIVDAYDHLQKLLEKYNDDYGTFTMNRNVDSIPTFSKLIDHFWF